MITLTRPVKIGLIAAGALLALGIIIVLAIVLTAGGSKQSLNNTNDTNANANLPMANSAPLNNDNANADTVSGDNKNTNEAVNTKDSLLRLGRIVVERYGSFSNRNNFENITRLEPFMTEDFKKISIESIDEQQKQPQEEDFYGIATSAIAMDLTNFSAKESAMVTVTTTRTESRANQDDNVFTQTAEVSFKYVSGNWKVDNITWK
ncbi:MAG: hypothetical protein A2233_04050 [Candidatus Kerfeldbacteria bacterium RIFOXYA2_FULL_38_24]|uniref:Uncharacterized protein n=1 Tax=Candidatus Kerfeldbacteria bacterium RIFOXYB2_FULL_38_14 TaxID=1798547 RepID=A0A1G2BER4_9BACT|nr:MAG: hypothetical protein A2233_04050 [Candidatus Kerfeldbacteria bacterium RIFOXYA2_FULL_38_24]OGY86740.1 MAG: hypothetical protein A2319_00785 [Candidatus Kerfeldbacteria bacterium RIFOXYB2_FULL_38_14]OGY90079.1 MAG: hypothetical protein A2458_00900 [Candidatus Kerfeldbacteria bacterium RIFOXYC2_FULL_38_9]